MKKIAKIANIVMYVLLIFTVLFTVMTLTGGTVEGDTNETPVFLDTVLNYTYFLIGACACIAILFEIYHVVTNPANAKRSLMSIGLIGVVILVSYMLSDGTPLKIIGYEGPDNVPSMLILSDVGLFVFYILFGITFGAIVYGEVSKYFK
jgi:hypothetical protein